MPTESSLSDKILLYFEVINRLTIWHEGFDSLSPEHKIFEDEVKYYLEQIRQETKLQKSCYE